MVIKSFCNHAFSGSFGFYCGQILKQQPMPDDLRGVSSSGSDNKRGEDGDCLRQKSMIGSAYQDQLDKGTQAGHLPVNLPMPHPFSKKEHASTDDRQ